MSAHTFRYTIYDTGCSVPLAFWGAAIDALETLPFDFVSAVEEALKAEETQLKDYSVEWWHNWMETYICIVNSKTYSIRPNSPNMLDQLR